MMKPAARRRQAPVHNVPTQVNKRNLAQHITLLMLLTGELSMLMLPTVKAALTACICMQANSIVPASTQPENQLFYLSDMRLLYDKQPA